MSQAHANRSEGAGEIARGADVTSPLPVFLLSGVVAAAVTIVAAVGPIRDIDSYWHLLVGQEVLAGAPVAEAARGWSFAPVPDAWISTQWLAEVLFARLYQWSGLQALIVYRDVTTMLAIAALAAVTLWRRPARAGTWVFTLAALALSIAVSERSQQLTYVLAPLLGWWAERLLRNYQLPRWWLVLSLVVVWSNFHGGWLLLPLVLSLAGLARMVDQGWRDLAAYRAWLLAALSFGAACVSPSGVGNAFAAARFAQATSGINEWHAARPWDWQAVPFLLVVLVVLISWILGRSRPSRGEVLLVLAITAFGLMAWRNLTPTALVLAPLTTGILARALGEPDPSPPGTRTPLARSAFALALLGAVFGIVLAFRQAPVVPGDIPQRLLSVVREVNSPQRVLNTYNISGPLLWFGGPPPHVLVGIDGRADRYGSEYIDEYQAGLINARPGWEKLFDQLKPTCALLRTDEALSGVLVAQRDWIEVGREGDYVLLRAPTTTGFPAHA